MQTIECLHHLVHIWFDRESQPILTEVIKRRIEEISDKACDVLNFVWEPKYSKKETEQVQILKLAETIKAFIFFNRLKSFPIDIEPDNLKQHPKIVIDYLYEIINWKWQKLREPSEENYSYCNHLFEEFFQILIMLVSHFGWKNIYNIEHNDDITNYTTTNQERLDELMEYAKSLLWDNRVIISWMNDGDVNKIAWLCTTKIQLGDISEIESPEDKMWEEDYWNAYNIILWTNRDITRMKYRRFKKAFFWTLKQKWFLIKPYSTKHIIWWEYFYRCVHSYWRLLVFYWIHTSRISIDPSISLIK